jgi:peptidyl-prolyl cis-trans isomerase D
MIKFLQTPGKAKKIVLGSIIVIFCFAMVITLVPGGILGDSFGFSLGQNVVAKVGDQEVNTQDIDLMARQIAQQQFGQRSIPPALLPFLRQSAAEQLLIKGAILSEADRLGLQATDAELRDELEHGVYGQTFFPNGQFIGQDAYENLITTRAQVSVPQFEQSVKEQLSMSNLRAAVVAPVTVTPAEVATAYKRDNTKIKFDYAVLTPQDIEKQIHPTEAELKAFYDNSKSLYNNSIPEKRQIRYVVIDTNKLAADTQVSQQDLQRYYSQHQDQFRVPEEVKVSHILIKTPLPGPDGKVDPKAVADAKAKAEDILKKLQGGANFADLAKKNSDDPGSAAQGGELGWIGRGRTVPEFEKAAFGLKPGQMSSLVQSSYGFHIIKVEDRHDAHLKTLEEVKAEIEPQIKREKAAGAAQTLAGTIYTQSRTQGLDKAAQAHGLQVQISGTISRTDTLPGIGSAPELTEAIFNAKANSPAEQAPTPTGYAVFQVTDIKPPATPTFEEARSKVEADFRTQQSAKMLQQKIKQLADRARAEHNLKKAALEVGATVKTSELVSSKDQVPQIGAMSGPASIAFELSPGQVSAPIDTSSGAVVIAVTDKQEPSADEAAKNSDEVREALLQQKRAEAFQVFATDLRQRLQKEGKIRINKTEWERVMNNKPQSGS